LQGKYKIWIPMDDGLKQGCPLSPLFFILAIDPLLTQLDKLPGIVSKAFADDLAAGFTQWGELYPVFLLVDLWSNATGCKANAGKTKIVSSNADTPTIADLVPPGWKDISVAEKYIYLGILVGRSVTSKEVYSRAMKKFEARVYSYMPNKLLFNMPTRVIMANTYLIPIFSYIFRFYLMNKSTENQVRRLLTLFLIHSDSTNIARLCAPTCKAGLKQPLKEIRLLNVATVLRSRAKMPSAKTRVQTGTLIIHKHIRLAVREYRRVVGSAPNEATPQKVLYHTLINADDRADRRLRKTLAGRIRRRGLDQDPSALMLKIYDTSASLPKGLPSHLRAHAFDVIHSTLQTGHRISKKHGVPDPGCRLCQESKVEDMRHLFTGHCKVVRAALDRICSGEGGEAAKTAAHFLKRAEPEDLLLVSGAKEQGLTKAAVAWSWAIWRARWAFKDSPASLEAKQIEKSIDQKQIEKSIVQKFVSAIGATDRPNVSSKKEEAKRCFLNLVKSLPAQAYVVYTDGSALNNPGQSGAGVVLYSPDDSMITSTVHLGVGTNNTAEVWAISRLSEILLTLDRGDNLPVYCFTDNRTAIKVATGYQPDWCKVAAQQIHNNLAIVSQCRSVTFFWVPAHIGIPGNEKADKLAKKGAAGHTTTIRRVSDSRKGVT
jgi:ribonuclease HI